ncbi:hypothetical protein MIND_00067500 [Mycena indigotica]|uniref:F-box domain-containing protein n=1 Tax=Mycena indigotica TaxID=2126181 RepID=A0A8H6TF29_9AGAR|nr:uncharacterized protein MIND_00067500 [Mycena indigotica]KAF7315522.1 hypothetical protein MIND_00067500 [Mycena indigotica]
MLPVELYAEIAQSLPAHHLKKLLSVSRLLHDVALRLLFSTVKIYFMHGEHGYYMLNTENERYVVETSEFCSNRSWEMLLHIITTPAFARVIKTFSVHAFTDGPQIFEYRTLALALSAMPNLRNLNYYGENPSILHVAFSIPPSVRYLRLQSLPDADLISHLSQLNALQVAIPFFYVREQKVDAIFAEWPGAASDPRDVMAVVESNPIQELVILSAHLPLLSVRLCNNLTRLDICVTDWELVGAELLFRHASQLEGLSIVGHVDPSFFASLPADPGVLPRLTTFRISGELWDDEVIGLTVVPYLRHFLERRVRLERLYIRLPGLALQFALAIVDVIAKLPNIRALGLHLGYEYLHDSAAVHLAEQLSPRIEALHLAIPWLSESHVRVWYPILNRLQQFENLSFLSLFSSGEDPVPIHPADLLTDLPRLRLIGLQRSLFSVDQEDMEEPEPKLWTPWAVKYCIREDFESDDHWWLFRYH